METVPESELIGWILGKLNLSEAELAVLLNVEESTVFRWIEEGRIYYNCAHIILRLLDQYPEEMGRLLSEGVTLRADESVSWAQKVRTIRQTFNVSKSGLSEFLGTYINVLRSWEEGAAQPSGCYSVLIDLLYHRPGEMSSLLGLGEERPEVSAWSRERLTKLVVATGLQPAEILRLLGMARSAWTEWAKGTSRPGPCAGLFLSLLEAFPSRMKRILTGVEPEPAHLWDATRVRELRERLGFGLSELSEAFGIDHETLYGWESEGLPRKFACVSILYSILDSEPLEIMKLVSKLRDK